MKVATIELATGTVWSKDKDFARAEIRGSVVAIEAGNVLRYVPLAAIKCLWSESVTSLDFIEGWDD